MGFDPEIHAELNFEGTKYAGAEVTVRLNPDADTSLQLEELENSGQVIRLLIAFGTAVLAITLLPVINTVLLTTAVTGAVLLHRQLAACDVNGPPDSTGG